MPEHDAATTRALAKIDDLPLGRILDKAARNHGWNPRRAERAELWYKRFLKLCFLNRREPIGALSRDADELWHQHLLDSPVYRRDSQRLFRHYLDHDPRYGRATPADTAIFRRSVQLYVQEYGKPPPDAVNPCTRIPTKGPGGPVGPAGKPKT